MLRSASFYLVVLSSVLLTTSAFAAKIAVERSPLPDEVEAIGGQGAAQVNSGVAASSDHAAIHLNPAMLFMHRAYDVGAGYYWPAQGRPFYKLSVIDGTTSRVVVGFEYTGFQENLRDRAEQDKEGDSPVRRRGSVAFAIPTDLFAIGFSGHYVEAANPSLTVPDQEQDIKGIALGAGLVALLNKQIRLAASVENFNNRRVAAVAPKTIRAGLAWEDPSATVAAHAEFRQRERSLSLELPLPSSDSLTLLPEDVSTRAEKMVLGGFQVKTFDLLKVFAGYGRTLQDKEREVIGGGMGIFQKGFSLSYATSKNLPNAKDWQSSLHISVTMKM